MPIDPAPPPPLVPRIGRYYCSGLGERSAGYNPDLLDYMGYERDRTHFLMSDRARAVMEEGGIVWRLGIEHLNYDDVVGGPVDVAAGLYERFDGEPVGGWDDKLTDHELDLMCGVYKIFTAPGTYQQADASWWPKSSTWKASAMDVGYWTHTCEEWFQRRLKGIRAGEENVRSAKQWRQALKLHKTSKTFVENIRVRCEVVLNP
ncbi:hypothetical protein FIBSPDRAFT_743283 [Athelia psychrophila]|uniref:Uncharacterized protein n=1 Tax=Athelia psychrophila TaxID=1759441 RepID=A0A166IH98_9AGAM|nr:hypothetical protein FIBSPDRAFT_743283 [Fibularhizoctonia sp. CBS 109695]